MAYQCFKLALAAKNDHAEAYNNLGVLEWKRGREEQVCGWRCECVCVCVCVCRGGGGGRPNVCECVCMYIGSIKFESRYDITSP